MRRVTPGRLLAAVITLPGVTYAGYVALRAFSVALLAIGGLMGRGPGLEGIDVARAIFLI